MYGIYDDIYDDMYDVYDGDLYKYASLKSLLSKAKGLPGKAKSLLRRGYGSARTAFREHPYRTAVPAAGTAGFGAGFAVGRMTARDKSIIQRIINTLESHPYHAAAALAALGIGTAAYGATRKKGEMDSLWKTAARFRLLKTPEQELADKVKNLAHQIELLHTRASKGMISDLELKSEIARLNKNLNDLRKLTGGKFKGVGKQIGILKSQLNDLYQFRTSPAIRTWEKIYNVGSYPFRLAKAHPYRVGLGAAGVTGAGILGRKVIRGVREARRLSRLRRNIALGAGAGLGAAGLGYAMFGNRKRR